MDFGMLGGLLGGVGGFVNTMIAGSYRDKATQQNDALIAANRKRQEEIAARQRAEQQSMQDKMLADSRAAAAASQQEFDNMALLQLLATAGLMGPPTQNPGGRGRLNTNRTGPAGLDNSMLNSGRRRLLGN